ncbi:unnamed protein product [Adineta steineri]|uniref:Uncharacterized protein n=1 Tax=Adineta steineri TaxID=433720 RepID=A0A813VZI7_9BILA|nr:unnamed protein product [Adineta steineri]
MIHHYLLAAVLSTTSDAQDQQYQQPTMDNVSKNMDNLSIVSEKVCYVLDEHLKLITDLNKNEVGGADRSGAKGVATTFIADKNDASILDEVRNDLNIQITEMPN